MTNHNATAQQWGGQWRGGCNQCGWIQRGSATRTQRQAAKSAERHNVEATQRDEAIAMRLFGPKAANH